jgi:hypothetical protein
MEANQSIFKHGSIIAARILEQRWLLDKTETRQHCRLSWWRLHTAGSGKEREVEWRERLLAAV